jgi:hypothetical protein
VGATRPCRNSRSGTHQQTKFAGGQVIGVCFSLVPFFCTSKRKTLAVKGETQLLELHPHKKQNKA